MPTTTLNAIRAHSPCADGWKKLLSHLGKTQADDEPLSLLTILDSNGLDDALWCLRTMPEHSRHWRLYAVWCARQLQHLMTDARSVAALDVAERHANGEATDEQLAAARAAASDASAAARAADRAAARAAAFWAAASVATSDAAWATTSAACAARVACAAKVAQANRLREVCAQIDATGESQ
jgi:hypothetical protein